jgi:glucose-1-phosphate adenylyltransferase
MDYGRMLAFHARHHADMSVACIDVPIAEAREFGVMNVDDEGRVIDFVEKPASPPPCPATRDGRWPPWASISSTPIFSMSSLAATR